MIIINLKIVAKINEINQLKDTFYEKK